MSLIYLNMFFFCDYITSLSERSLLEVIYSVPRSLKWMVCIGMTYNNY